MRCEVFTKFLLLQSQPYCLTGCGHPQCGCGSDAVYQDILKEVDEQFTDEELDGIMAEVRFGLYKKITCQIIHYFRSKNLI